MKKSIFFIFLIILPAYLLISLHFLDKEYFLCPIKFERDILIRSDHWGSGLFGAERSGRRVHQGIDLFAPIGTPVYASRCGRVVAAKQNRGMGKYVVIKHAYGIITIYGHLSQILVEPNNFLRQGDCIGRVGKTGNANLRAIQPHLHFEVKNSGIPQDPLDYLQ
ncbi:MAG: hypothetical protein A2984_01850 [Omnitrophica WOR_2 bacterium RIFCSPLOWO2_01_FULL_41_12]|nr:MAG: hypothetical protein A2984_01850 [Omnitrophica WOR_2 bacterium RIFCSPLOWO2_01_FULL_41_12]